MDKRASAELADIVREHGAELRENSPLSAEQERVLRDIERCRSAALGGHIDQCTDCGKVHISYNSCRNRHCPKCQWSEREQWLEKRLEHLLPCPHFHVVFTIPDSLNPLALRNKRCVYNILFKAASQTLLRLAADPKRLGAQIGFTAVLHTWGQNLFLHPHLHCVVTGGGLSLDGERWIYARERYFLPVKVLAKLFRGLFLDALRKAYRDNQLDFAGSTEKLADEESWSSFIDELYSKDWVVYAKPPFGGAEHVFRYLGAYTHRVAISNQRIVSLEHGKVAFTAKDYAKGAQRILITLTALEFLRRFLLHVIPKRFHRIRHYGLLAPANVRTKLIRARRILRPNAPVPVGPTPPLSWQERILQSTGIDPTRCSSCGGTLTTTLIPAPALPGRPRARASPLA